MPFIDNKISSLAIDVAASIQDRILGDYLAKTNNISDIISISDALPFDDDFISKASSPSQHTLLHKFIESYLDAEYQYGYRKFEENYPPMVYELLDAYDVKYERIEYSGRESNSLLYEMAISSFRPLAHDAFGILFQNRKLMRDFGRLISSVSNQLFPRANYWPSWLKDALVNREHGRCALCSCDLTGVIAIEKKIHIDHIIPISNFGTNDPTNLQILCEPCNLTKGNRNENTSAVRHVPWKL